MKNKAIILTAVTSAAILFGLVAAAETMVIYEKEKTFHTGISRGSNPDIFVSPEGSIVRVEHVSHYPRPISTVRVSTYSPYDLHEITSKDVDVTEGRLADKAVCDDESNYYIGGRQQVNGGRIMKGGSDVGYIDKYNSDMVLEWSLELPTQSVSDIVALDNGELLALGNAGTMPYDDETYALAQEKTLSASGVFRIDSKGKIVDQKLVDVANNVSSHSLVVVSDGIFVCGTIAGKPKRGYRGDSITRRESFLVKYDFEGNFIWEHKFNDAVVATGVYGGEEEGSLFVYGRAKEILGSDDSNFNAWVQTISLKQIEDSYSRPLGDMWVHDSEHNSRASHIFAEDSGRLYLLVAVERRYAEGDEQGKKVPFWDEFYSIGTASGLHSVREIPVYPDKDRDGDPNIDHVVLTPKGVLVASGKMWYDYNFGGRTTEDALLLFSFDDREMPIEFSDYTKQVLIVGAGIIFFTLVVLVVKKRKSKELAGTLAS